MLKLHSPDATGTTIAAAPWQATLATLLDIAGITALRAMARDRAAHRTAHRTDHLAELLCLKNNVIKNKTAAVAAEVAQDAAPAAAPTPAASVSQPGASVYIYGTAWNLRMMPVLLLLGSLYCMALYGLRHTPASSLLLLAALLLPAAGLAWVVAVVCQGCYRSLQIAAAGIAVATLDLGFLHGVELVAGAAAMMLATLAWWRYKQYTEQQGGSAWSTMGALNALPLGWTLVAMIVALW